MTDMIKRYNKGYVEEDLADFVSHIEKKVKKELLLEMFEKGTDKTTEQYLEFINSKLKTLK